MTGAARLYEHVRFNNDRYCPGCGRDELKYGTPDHRKRACHPDDRFKIGKLFRRRPCPIGGVHWHVRCRSRGCGCTWIVDRKVTVEFAEEVS